MKSTVAFPGPRLCVDVLAGPECIPFVSSVTQTFLIQSAGLGERWSMTSQVRIAVVEMVTNVVRHGYRDREVGPVSVELEAHGGWITAHIRDHGQPFDSRRRATLPDPSRLAEGGYGLGIVQSVMDELDYEYGPDTGNHFIMRKRIVAAETGDPA